MTTREFPMRVVVSVYRNRLLCPFDEYRAFINWMINSDVPLWDVSRARETVAASIARQIPELADTDPPPDKTDSGNANKYIKACCKQAGFEWVELTQMRSRFKVRTASKALK